MHLEDNSPTLAELTEVQREQAMARFRVLRSHTERGVPLPRAAQAAGVGLRTVERWLAQYRADGLAGLVRRTREDRGYRKLPAEAVELIEGLFLKKPRPSAAAVYRRVLTLCKEQEWPSPSYSTVYAIIARLNPALTVHRDGIHFQGIRYMDPTLAAYVKEAVTIRYDPRDVAEVRVFHRNRFLCRAVRPEYSGQGITLKDIQAARSTHRRAFRGQIRERVTPVADFLSPPVEITVPPAPEPSSAQPKKVKLRTYREDLE